MLAEKKTRVPDYRDLNLGHISPAPIPDFIHLRRPNSIQFRQTRSLPRETVSCTRNHGESNIRITESSRLVAETIWEGVHEGWLSGIYPVLQRFHLLIASQTG